MMETATKNRFDAFAFLSRYGIYFALVLLVIVLSITSPPFRSLSNIENILQQISVNGIIAIGMTLVIITAGIDLSVGSVLALSAVVAASFAHPDTPSLLVPILVGVTTGLACGVVNGVLIAKSRLAPFIVTLGMMTVARGVALVYSSGRPIINLSSGYDQIGGGMLGPVPISALIFFVVVLAGIFLLHYARFGRYVYAVGGNELAAKVSGVNTDRVLIGVYALAGALAGLAGIVLSSRVMSGSPTTGTGYELDAIAAVVIGGTALSGGVGTIMGTIVGVLIIGVMNNGLDLLNVSSYWQQIVKGVIIILAVIWTGDSPASRLIRSIIKSFSIRSFALTALALGALVFIALSFCSKVVSPVGHRLTIGVTYQNLQNEFIIGIQDAIRIEAKKQGVELVEADGQGKAENQISQTQDFIARGVNVIILNPFDREGSAHAVDLALQSHTPIVVVNAQVANVDKADAFVGSEDEEAGRIAAQRIMDLLHGKGNIAVIHGPNGHSAEVARSEGIRQVVAKYPGAKIVVEQTANWDRVQALNLMENWLASGQKIDAVIAQNDEMALGAEKAIEAAGKQSQILVIGIDGIPDARKAVADGKLVGTVFQDAASQATEAVDIAIQLAHGQPVKHDNYIPFQLITKENLSNFSK
jgi:ribose/xylose/arabinose/galactoside ABC-type transport system permease subunit/ABC-type sugar transport system substrate-binding protein